MLTCTSVAWVRTRDPLHPLMYLGPMLFYVYVVRPGGLLGFGELQRLIPRQEQLVFAQGLFTIGATLFCTGVLLAGRRSSPVIARPLRFEVSDVVGSRLKVMGCCLGWVSVAAYVFAVQRSGGFLEVYGQTKGYVTAGSGWINELVNFSIPAVALLMLSWQGRPWRRGHLLWALFFSSPLLVHGLLGARRGPTFIVLTAALVAWYVTSPKRIALWKLGAAFAAIVGLVFFLVSHRQEIHIGSDVTLDWSKLRETVAPSKVTPADDTVFQYGFVNAIREKGKHFWGLRYAATYLVRPIPRQIWPTKYKDLGLGWMVDQSDFAGLDDNAWQESLGWEPQRGSAVGFTADLFLEFSWGGLIGCLLLGMFYGGLWRRAKQFGGLWVLLYIEAAALSVYVPTQSVSAVLHRFLFMFVPTLIFWHMLVAADHAQYQHETRKRDYLRRRLRVRRAALIAHARQERVRQIAAHPETAT